MNEVSLSANIKASGSLGQIPSDYDVPCGRMQAANLRGMSRAIVDERKRTGRPLRIILGTTDRSFGFLAFMEQQSVSFDVVGYHIYPWEPHPALDADPWFGAGGPLGQLAKFGRPIHLNEFNCGEIYSGSSVYPNDPSYENQASSGYCLQWGRANCCRIFGAHEPWSIERFTAIELVSLRSRGHQSVNSTTRSGNAACALRAPSSERSPN